MKKGEDLYSRYGIEGTEYKCGKNIDSSPRVKRGYLPVSFRSSLESKSPIH